LRVLQKGIPVDRESEGRAAGGAIQTLKYIQTQSRNSHTHTHTHTHLLSPGKIRECWKDKDYIYKRDSRNGTGGYRHYNKHKLNLETPHSLALALRLSGAI